MELRDGATLGSRPATTGVAATTGRLCGAASEMTDADIVAMVRAAVAPGSELTSEAFGPMRLGAVCDLGQGHPGTHASLQALPASSGQPALWLRWGDGTRAIVWA